MTDLLDVTLLVTDALDAHGIRYTVGGSLASSFSGEPRASIDADILVEMTATHVGPLLEALGDPFYADGDAVQRAVATRTAANLIHLRTTSVTRLLSSWPGVSFRLDPWEPACAGWCRFRR